jgi:ribonucleoside-diphosphate reductase beta chain
MDELPKQTIRLFDEQKERKPDLYPWTEDFINAMWKGFWTPNEFSFQSDLHDYKVNLSDEERRMIKNTLSAIAQIEVAVKKFWAKLGDNLPHPSINDLGAVMAHVETIHNRAYEKLLKVLNLEHIFVENMELDIIQGRVNYLHKYNHKYYKDSKKQYLYSITLFTLFVENVSLFSQFYVINWLNRYKNVLKDTAQQVSYTAKEEDLHHLAGVKIINTIRVEYPELFDEDLENKILSEAVEAYNCEAKIVDWIVGEYTGQDISAEILKTFIKNRINDSLEQIGYRKVFEDIDEDLLAQTEWFDDDVLANTNTDFFYARPVNYVKNDKTYNEEDIF